MICFCQVAHKYTRKIFPQIQDIVLNEGTISPNTDLKAITSDDYVCFVWYYLFFTHFGCSKLNLEALAC